MEKQKPKKFRVRFTRRMCNDSYRIDNTLRGDPSLSFKAAVLKVLAEELPFDEKVYHFYLDRASFAFDDEYKDAYTVVCDVASRREQAALHEDIRTEHVHGSATGAFEILGEVPVKEAKPRQPFNHRLTFEPRYPSSTPEAGHFYVYLVENDGDPPGNRICEVNGSDADGWRVEYGAMVPSDYYDHMRDAKFKSREDAAWFARTVTRVCTTIAEESPLPDDVVRYLEDRARQLQNAERAALNVFMDVRRERSTLRVLAKRLQMGDVISRTEDTDAEKCVRDLLEFMVTVPDDEDGGVCEVALNSEAALYHYFGKETGRTIQALLERVCKIVAPRVVDGD